MRGASVRADNFLLYRISASVSSKFLLTTLGEQSAEVDSYSIVTFEIVCHDTNDMSCASFKRTDRLLRAIFSFLICKKVFLVDLLQHEA